MSQETQRLVAQDQIQINSPMSKVWNVLVRPEYIRQWDDVPENFEKESLSAGAVLEWPGSACLTVTLFHPHSRLCMAYQNPKWVSKVDGIAYDYELQESSEGSLLIISVGDWAKVPDGRAQDYYGASIEFVQTALAKIKELAEG